MKTIFTKDLLNKKVFITREFAADHALVWLAWTDPLILDQWWAPQPWKAKTKVMDFKEGGHWIYCMEGPDGSQSWGREDYIKIDPIQSFEAIDSFCDENGKQNEEFPSMTWKNVFVPTVQGTTVEIEVTYPSQNDMEKMIEMGFEEGFAAAHDNLDALFAKA